MIWECLWNNNCIESLLLPMHVLIAEDEDQIALMYEILLQSNGHTTVRASDGDACIQLYEKNPKAFDIVLLDYRMPHRDGLSVAGRIFQLNPDQEVIMITAYVDVLVAELVRDLERSMTTLQKPVDPELLSRMIEDQVRSSKAAKQAAAS